MSSTYERAEAAVAALGPQSDAEAFAEAMDLVDGLAQRVRELREAHRRRAVEWLETHGSYRDERRVVTLTPKRTVRLRDVERALSDAIEATGGDVGALSEMIASNGVKHGAFRRVVGEEAFVRSFDEERDETVKVISARPVDL